MGTPAVYDDEGGFIIPDELVGAIDSLPDAVWMTTHFRISHRRGMAEVARDYPDPGWKRLAQFMRDVVRAEE